MPGLQLTFALRFDYAEVAQPLHGGRCPLLPRRLSAALTAANRARGELILCTVTFRPNRAHNWTCSPSYIFGREGGSRRCAPSAYFSLLSLGYAAGLSLAFIANALGWTIAGVRGQPALLYLVPCTLLPLVLAAALRGDLCTMWRGTHLAPHAKAGGEGDGVHAEGERAGGEMQERTALADERDAEIGASDPRSE